MPGFPHALCTCRARVLPAIIAAALPLSAWAGPDALALPPSATRTAYPLGPGDLPKGTEKRLQEARIAAATGDLDVALSQYQDLQKRLEKRPGLAEEVGVETAMLYQRRGDRETALHTLRGISTNGVTSQADAYAASIADALDAVGEMGTWTAAEREAWVTGAEAGELYAAVDWTRAAQDKEATKGLGLLVMEKLAIDGRLDQQEYAAVKQAFGNDGGVIDPTMWDAMFRVAVDLLVRGPRESLFDFVDTVLSGENSTPYVQQLSKQVGDVYAEGRCALCTGEAAATTRAQVLAPADWARFDAAIRQCVQNCEGGPLSVVPSSGAGYGGELRADVANACNPATSRLGFYQLSESGDVSSLVVGIAGSRSVNVVIDDVVRHVAVLDTEVMGLAAPVADHGKMAKCVADAFASSLP